MSVAVFVWQAGAILAFGGSLFLARAGVVPHALIPWRDHVATAFALGCAFAWCAGWWVVDDLALRIVGARLAWDAPEWTALLTRTRIGQVWLVKQGLLSCLFGLVCTLRWRHRFSAKIVVAFAALFLLSGLWAGHGGASAPLLLNFPLHVVHALAAAGWLGGLPLWAWLVWHADLSEPSLRYLSQTLRAFSRFAMLMIGILVVTGSLIAWRQFSAWPAILGTGAGATLMVKLALLGVALNFAWQLRQQYLHRLTLPHDRPTRRGALCLIGGELLAALGVLALALELARMTPGAHQPITWWLPFRFAPTAALTEPLAVWSATVGSAITLCALPAWLARRPRFVLTFVLLGFGILLYAIAVPAFPDTYRQSTVAYNARSITRGAALFSTQCAGCHGTGARGDEREAATLAPDLSEHTALHTAGDMFWWLTHGTPSGKMPAFGAVLSESERWHLINFLRAFADGHRARVLGPEWVPRQPWLGAPNLFFETTTGHAAELRDFREQEAVLLVLASLPTSTERLRELAGSTAFQNTRLKPILVLRQGKCADLGQIGNALSCVGLGRQAIAFAYSLLARTLDEPGSRHALAPSVSHAEYLIDRFGYLRARWAAVAGANAADSNSLAEISRALAQEPKIRESPDEHVH